jgi:glycosyltransferase involved in cell wall biosynthesis
MRCAAGLCGRQQGAILLLRPAAAPEWLPDYIRAGRIYNRDLGSLFASNPDYVRDAAAEASTERACRRASRRHKIVSIQRKLKRVLMVAFHFPPYAGSSGVQRALRFVQYLPDFGWEATVLSANARAYECTSDDLLAAVPAQTHVERAFALNAAKHLSIRGRYLGITAVPDRWASWRFQGVRSGLHLVEKFKPDVIWSTYPIPTAHAIARALHVATGLPWIAEFRDPMAQNGYPADRTLWKSFKRIEEQTLKHAHFDVFTTSGAARMYAERYPDVAQRIRVIENGFDEDSFAGLTDAAHTSEPLSRGAITLLHSGVVYPSERDPQHLFQALRLLADAGRITPARLRVRLRATAHDEVLRLQLSHHGVADFVELLPAIPYSEALQEMLRADGLLVMQAAHCDEQIPAKLYEYLRAGRPIVGLTSPQGSTARTLRAAGLDMIAPLDSVDGIMRVLEQFMTASAAGHAPRPNAEYVDQCSRRARTRALAGLLDEAALGSTPVGG